MIKRWTFRLSPVGEVEDPNGEYIKITDIKFYIKQLKMNIGSHDMEWEEHNFFLEELNRLIK